MGVSTDAILFWGFPLDEGVDFPWLDDEKYNDEWEDYYLEQLGHEIPTFDWGSYESSKRNEWADRDRYDNWRELKKRLIKESRCQIGYHCSDDYTLYYVCVAESETTAHRGYPKKIEFGNYDSGGWDEALMGFCEVLGITFYSPDWYLVSYWG